MKKLLVLALAVLLFASQAVFAQTTITTVDRFTCGRQLVCNNIPNDRFDDQGIMWDLDVSNDTTGLHISINHIAFGPAGLTLNFLGKTTAYATDSYSVTGRALGADGTVIDVNIKLTHYHGAGSGRGGCYGCTYRWYVTEGSTVTIQ
jgi:hypothetical protein